MNDIIIFEDNEMDEIYELVSDEELFLSVLENLLNEEKEKLRKISMK